MTPWIMAMFGLPGGWEWIIILLVALLIFGRRLPDVARSVGKSIVEFKKGLRDIKDDVENEDDRSNSQRRLEDQGKSEESAKEPSGTQGRSESKEHSTRAG